MRRPALDELRAAARTGTVNRIYTFKLDRLTRTGVSDTFALLNEFKLAGCEVIAVADNLHLKLGEDDMQTVVFQFALGLAAKLERQAIGERIAAARNRLEAEGRAWGRPARLTGLKLEQAKALRAEGRSIREIAVAMKVPRSTVGRALSQKGGSNEKGR
jgi:DNA invertase Pin-like site-specific DNA recombinase